jgi:NTP pyrophosphatase (non-canonical NTP hydrolase)
MTPAHIDFQIYQHRAMRTAKPMEPSDDLMHAALGLAGEAGEFADAVKKHLVYGQPLDKANAIEEIGDIMWFCALACSALSIDMGRVAQMNIDKLKRRYPEKYADDLAVARLDKEKE